MRGLIRESVGCNRADGLGRRLHRPRESKKKHGLAGSVDELRAKTAFDIHGNINPEGIDLETGSGPRQQFSEDKFEWISKRRREAR